MQIAGSVEVSVVVWSQYITLKLFWRTLENDVIKWPLFHASHKAFYKNFIILPSTLHLYQLAYWLIENLAQYKESCISA